MVIAATPMTGQHGRHDEQDEQGRRRQTGHDGERGQDHRAQAVAAPVFYGLQRRLAFLLAVCNRHDEHDRIVDDDAGPRRSFGCSAWSEAAGLPIPVQAANAHSLRSPGGSSKTISCALSIRSPKIGDTREPVPNFPNPGDAREGATGLAFAAGPMGSAPELTYRLPASRCPGVSRRNGKWGTGSGAVRQGGIPSRSSPYEHPSHP